MIANCYLEITWEFRGEPGECVLLEGPSVGYYAIQSAPPKAAVFSKELICITSRSIIISGDIQSPLGIWQPYGGGPSSHHRDDHPFTLIRYIALVSLLVWSLHQYTNPSNTTSLYEEHEAFLICNSYS